jgi:phosphoribosylamine--glycine ligase
MEEILKKIIEPLLKGMQAEGRVYKGVLYAGLMLTEQGPKVLEFNVRFGDPETQSILPRLKNDLTEVLEAVVDERLSRVKLDWDVRPCVCVVVASGGYPGNYQKGKPINGLNETAGMKDVVVFHAGTKRQTSPSPLVGEGKGEGIDTQFLTDGGRVLGVTALGTDFISAQRHAYEAVHKIHFEGMHFRKDIAHRAITTSS